MEDQKLLKAFGDDSIQEMKDSISKDLVEFRSMLLEVLRKKTSTSFESRNTAMDAKLWQFQGENPEGWIFQAEHYFDFYKIEDDQKLTVASFYLDGEASKWYRWLFRNKQLLDWPHFADKVRIRFKQKGFESMEGRFEYPSRFEAISSAFSESDVYSTQYWNARHDYNDQTFAHKVFGENPNRKTENVVDIEIIL
ncbi:uncharacterized protein LOC132042701 [Lycium ferocissimum]|uniref:uncharacterized protein LOC132042701 n=1 Tax=Lycium ferocissimum TaxID=112874 RepID=UPI002814DB1E|nr:uncharacterized protein LOC132042701 [Lycium ferocissimum]